MVQSLIYLDHNASTPPAEPVISRMVEVMQTAYANASSTDHVAGAAAAQITEEARSHIASGLGVRGAEVLFTSGATESNGLALRGAFATQKQRQKPGILIAETEHPSVLQTCQSLAERGAELRTIRVGSDGRVDVAHLRELLTADVGLISVMAANNETGVINPIEEIAELLKGHDALFHSDFTQAVGYLPIDFAKIGIHLASFSGHKMYGPKGVGGLYVRSRRPRARLVAQQTGGGQERGLRSGTLNTEGIAGLGAAFAVRKANLRNCEILRGRRDWLEQRLLAIPGASRNGSVEHRLPHCFNLSISGVDPHALQHALRSEIVFSTSSACSTEKVETSSVLRAMLGDGPQARNAFRIGLGFGTSQWQIERAASLMARAVDGLRSGILGRNLTTDLVK